MNINFCVAAISERGRQLLPSIWESALDLGGEAFDTSNATIRRTDRRAVMNACSIEGTWSVPTWLEDQHGVISLSQPPISYKSETPLDKWHSWAIDTLRDDQRRKEVQPGYFGVSLWSDDGMEVWNDVSGFARCYVVENDDFVAAGNHIGMVSLFSSESLEVDTYGADVLAQVGFWPEDRSPVSTVRRLGAGEVVAIGHRDETSHRQYVKYDELIGYRDAEPDVLGAAESMRTLTSNAGAIAQLPPTVHLSGGQDSRVTAAAWIAGGRPATIHTIGTLQGEVDIATQLLSLVAEDRSLEDRGLVHRVAKPNPRRLAEFSIEDRLAHGMLMWDGDFAPGKLRAPIRRPAAASRLAIGGANGEVMHGMHYPTSAVLEEVRKLPHPLDRLPKAFPEKFQNKDTRAAAIAYFERQKHFVNGLGHEDATALNIFHTTSKSRRWTNGQLSSTSFTLLANPTFVRAAIDLTPEQRLDRVMQKSLSRALTPQWEQVPYYKASHAETTKEMKPRGIRTWETSPGSMERLLHERTDWQRWFDRTKMMSLERAVHNGQGNSAHESTLSLAYLLDAIPDHVTALERRRRALWR